MEIYVVDIGIIIKKGSMDMESKKKKINIVKLIILLIMIGIIIFLLVKFPIQTIISIIGLWLIIKPQKKYKYIFMKGPFPWM